MAEVGVDTSKAERGLTQFGNKLNQTGHSGGQSMLPVRTALGGVEGAAKTAAAGIAGLGAAMVGGALVGFAGQLAGSVMEMAKAADASGRLQVAFDGLAATAGTSSSQIMTRLQQASGGAIAEYDLMLAANKAMMLGVADSAEEMGQLMEIARVRGTAMGLSTAQAFDNLVTGLGRGSALILDNLGIIVDAEAANEAYATSIGKTVSQLTEQEKKQALVNVTLAEATGEALPAASAYERMGAAMADMKVELGDLFNPAIAAAANMIAAGIGAVNDRIAEGEMAKNLDDFHAAQENIGLAFGRYEEEFNAAKSEYEAAAAVFSAFNPNVIVEPFAPDLTQFDELSQRWSILKQKADDYNAAAANIGAPKLNLDLLKMGQMETEELKNQQAAVDAAMAETFAAAFEKLDAAAAAHNERQAAMLASAREYQGAMMEVAAATSAANVPQGASVGILANMAAQYDALTSSSMTSAGALYTSAEAMAIVTENAMGTIAGFEAMAAGAIVAGETVAAAMIAMAAQVSSAFASMFAGISAMGADLMRVGPGSTPGESPKNYLNQTLRPDTTLASGAGTNDQFEGMALIRAHADKAAADAAQKLADKAARAADKLGSAAQKAGDLSGKLQGILDKIPGLTGTSEVTEEQMRLGEMGVPQNFADDYLRRLTDEVVNGVDWAGVDIGDAAQRAGINPNLPAEVILEMFKNAWADSSLFANAGNLDLINMDAVKAAIQQQQAAETGKANIMALFGIGDDATVAAVAGLGLDIQSGLSGWLTDNGMGDAGTKLAGAMSDGVTEAGIPVDGGLSSWLGSDSGGSAVSAFGKDLGDRISNSTRVTPILNMPETLPTYNGGSNVPGRSDVPPVSSPSGGTRGQKPSATGGASVVVNATVMQPHDIPLLARAVMREIQRH